MKVGTVHYNIKEIYEVLKVYHADNILIVCDAFLASINSFV